MTSVHYYEDIIDLPHPDPKRHTRMSVQARAAQFMPFAALTGYAAVIDEVSRTTEEKPILDESEKQKINRRLLYLREQAGQAGNIRVVYFLPDMKKAGGSIETACAPVKKIDDFSRMLILQVGRRIPFDDIISIRLTEND